MKTDWIGWAFSARHPDADGLPGEPLNAGEKLVLVYLAAQVGADGCARLDRALLAEVTDYEPRSLQRILKSLRDAHLLHDQADAWYTLGAAEEPGTLRPPELPEAPTGPQRVSGVARMLDQGDLEAAGETIAQHVNDAADRLMNRLNDSALRLLGGMERLVLSLDSPAELPAPPPLDPVRTSRQYELLVTNGYEPAEAYRVAKLMIDAGIPDTVLNDKPVPDASPAPSHTRSMRSPEPVRAAAAADRGVQGGGGASLAESAEERFLLVWNQLHTHPPIEEVHTELLEQWLTLEAEENKHSVTGESVTAFEQLFPAILAAARTCAGQMTMREFLDPVAIRQGKAPWDAPAAATGPTESLMQSETSRMLAHIQRARHPTIDIGPPTTERDEDTGVTRTESTHSYYLRVKRVFQQLRQWQQMTEE